MIEFWAKLIVANKEQTDTAKQSLKDNCTYVDNDCWIFEGEVDALDGVDFG